MREPDYMCPALDRILDYLDKAEAHGDRKVSKELDKARREIERVRTRIDKLRSWGHHVKR